MKTIFIVFFVVISIGMIPKSFSQENDVSTDIMLNMSLEDLMNIEVSVASKSSISNIRETPGVISIISRRDIEMSGAYDLLGILQRLVPGFGFATNVEGIVGIGIRGLWSHEGKVLLMIDGKSINDEQFANTLFGNHISADVIEKVEIIRGPGSSIYGGYASLGVINVITRNFENSAVVSFSGGYADKTFSHQNIMASAGVNRGELKFTVNTAFNRGFRSNLTHRDYFGYDTTFLNSNELNSIFISANLEYKKLKLSYLVDKYETTTFDLWGSHSREAYAEKWDTYAFGGSYDFEFESLKVTPYVKYKYQLPWHTFMIPEEYTNSKHVAKITAGVVASYSMSDQMTATAGVEAYQHDLNMPEKVSIFEETFRSGKDVMRIQSFSAFTEIALRTSFAKVLAGVRFDAFDKFSNSFLPRVAVTKVINDLHFKGMLSGSFRIPGGIIPNRTLNLNDRIKPETVWSYELEAGYKIGNHSLISFNGFYHDLRQVIVYQTAGSIGFYGNGGRFGSAGLESTYRYVTNDLNLNINYAFYAPVGNNDNMYRMPEKNGYYIGFAKHRLNMNASLRIVDDLFFNFIGRIYGERYGIVGSGLIDKMESLMMTDFNLRAKNVFFDGLNASIGIDNVFDYKFIYYSDSDAGHAGLPGFGRTLVLKMDYNF